MPNAPEKIEFVTDAFTGVAVPRVPRVLLVGGPHTGKTEVLVSRVDLCWRQGACVPSGSRP